MLLDELKKLRHQHVALEYVHPNRSMYYAIDGWIVRVLGNETLVLAIPQQSQIPQSVAPAQPGMPLSQSNIVASAFDTMVQYRFKFIPVSGIILLEAHGGIECRWTPQTPGMPAKLGRGTAPRPIYPLTGMHENWQQWQDVITKAWDEHLVKLGLLEQSVLDAEIPAPTPGPAAPAPVAPAAVAPTV